MKWPQFTQQIPSGMLGVPARMKPPLREFSVEIHQHARSFLQESICAAATRKSTIQKSKTDCETAEAPLQNTKTVSKSNSCRI